MKKKKKKNPEPINPAALRKVSEDISREYPIERWVSDFTEVVLLEVDPSRIHAYWHVTPPDLQVARRSHSLPNAPLVLRLYDVTGRSLDERPGAPERSLTIAGLSGETFFDDLAGGNVYVADLALVREDASMVGLTHSNPVHLPTDGASQTYELVMIDISQEEEGMPTPSELVTDVVGPLLPTTPTRFRRDSCSRQERPST